MQETQQQKKSTGKTLLILCNVVLMTAAILFAGIYSTRMRENQEQMELDAFCTTMESLKQVSANYLESERRYAEDWAAYIEAQEMSEDEALEYIRAANTQADRSANIVDMDTFEARSTFIRDDGSDDVNVYQKFAAQDTASRRLCVENMRRMFNGQAAVLGKYRIQESQYMVISVGTRVELRQPDGSRRGYLLLRLIPLESMKKIWIFPLEYSSSEIGLITTGCDYVIQSASMRSENFLEFIRAYNYADDYNGADVLLTRLAENDSGLLEYKNSRGELCYWYYSRLDGYQGLDILGCIPKAGLYRQPTDWSIVAVVLGVLALLVLLDGAHIMGINRRLRAAAKLAEQASDAKTQFLSSMSHDIRTPLNAVLGMTELAKAHGDDPAYVQRCLQRITVSGKHLLTLINDVLEISKIESGKTVLNPEPFVLEELVTSMEDIVRAQAEVRGVAFTLKVHDIAQPYLVGDKLRLSQIYLNLLTNAVKYTQPGGRVQLEVSEHAALDGSVELTCVIADTGMGMSEEFQRTMYDSFARAQDSRIDKIQGTGLGLAIAKRLLELMDGTIRCQSALGEGTVFTVKVPLKAAAPEEALEEARPGAAAGTAALEGLQVLVAEDNDLNWEIIAAMLEGYGVRCTRAADGRACVDMLEAAAPGTYDMVLMDIQMPRLNGRDATRLLRSSPRADLRSIPIAAMTADAFAEDVHACLEAGMDAHLAKPVDIQKVLAVMTRLCRRGGTK